ncbi:MAG: exodeoxyribonuclease VII large subunit [Syntrophobacterales bacterium]|nr:exodeoxyribonuclease VII large subunit [Syntrophobacterales bacterium]
MITYEPGLLHDLGGEGHILTVSEVTRKVKRLLEDEFAFCWVVGEISNLKEPSSGHLYFILKDSGAQLRAVCFRGSRPVLRFKPVDGLEVLCFGRITVYEPRGEYQIIVEYMEPRGIGALKMLFDKLREKLEKEGLFDTERKKALPVCPQRILIITSIAGAALRDILAILRRAPFPTEISIIPVKVQGDGASDEIVGAIYMANKLQTEKQWDLAIIGRGGGSIEDLWVFNEEKVVRALADMKIPTISAVGHEIDVTLSDLVADYRAPTPTAAAEWVVDQQEKVRAYLETYRLNLRLYIEDLMLRAQQTLDLLRERLKSPDQVLKEQGERINIWRERMLMAIRFRFDITRSNIGLLYSKLTSLRKIQEIPLIKQKLDYQRSLILKGISEVLKGYSEKCNKYLASFEALDPYRVLDRGYAIVTRVSDGRLVKGPEDVSKGEVLKIRVSKGEIFCIVL